MRKAEHFFRDAARKGKNFPAIQFQSVQMLGNILENRGVDESTILAELALLGGSCETGTATSVGAEPPWAEFAQTDVVVANSTAQGSDATNTHNINGGPGDAVQTQRSSRPTADDLDAGIALSIEEASRRSLEDNAPIIDDIFQSRVVPTGILLLEFSRDPES